MWWDVMGRYGYMNMIPGPTADRRIVAQSLERVQMTEFQNRQIGELR